MKNFGLKRDALLKLTILVLLAFSLYPSTKGNKIEGKESYMDSLIFILGELETFIQYLSKSRIEATTAKCFAGLVEGFETVEECKRAYKPALSCIANDLDACGVHPLLRASLMIYLNRFVSKTACLPISGE